MLLFVLVELPRVDGVVGNAQSFMNWMSLPFFTLQKFAEVVNQIVRACGGELLSALVAVGDTAGVRTGCLAHFKVESGIAHHKGLFRFGSCLRKNQVYKVGSGLWTGHGFHSESETEWNETVDSEHA